MSKLKPSFRKQEGVACADAAPDEEELARLREEACVDLDDGADLVAANHCEEATGADEMPQGDAEEPAEDLCEEEGE
eukprot:3611841-Karenia_brevis.AAC.1